MRGRCGIVFVHGIVGNNRIFDFLVPCVPEGYEVRFVSLDGHGGDALAFSRASMARWKAQVEEAVREMSSRCEKVLGVGHSMGCLLLMEQGARGLLSGLFLLNPPMIIRPRISFLTNAFKVAAGCVGNDPVALAAKDAYGVTIDLNPLHYYGWPRRYMELFSEISRIKKEVVSNVKCPVWAFLSAKDELVGPASVRPLEKLPRKTIEVLPDSTHYYYSEGDRRVIMEKFASVL